jgi:CheY-like chemotaxis protein
VRVTIPWVLVVDDDADVRMAVSDILEGAGYEVSGAVNGRDALRHLAEAGGRLPDLIVLDIMMPVMDGWEFLHELEHLPALDPVPVLVFTAHADAQQAGSLPRVAGCIPKPPTIELLVAAVGRHARRAEPGGLSPPPAGP